MALGKTVIAADCDNGPREVINKENGTLVPIDSPSALRAALKFYIENTGIAKNHGNNAYDTISENFVLAKQLERIENTLINLLNR